MGRHRQPFAQRHLRTHKDKNPRQALMQEPKTRQQVRQRKIKRPQTQNRKHVRRINNKWIARDSQNRRHGIHCKNNVHRFHSHQRQKERRRNRFSSLLHKEALALELIGHRNYPPRHQHQRIAIRPNHALAGKEHLQPGQQQQRAENIQHRVKRLQQLHSRQHKNRAHYQRTQHSQKQDLVLRLRRHVERLKDQQKNKNVVHTKRFLHQITGKKFHAHLRTQRIVEPQVENQRNGNPRRALQQRFAQADNVVFTM